MLETSSIRPPAVAGRFYPGTAEGVSADVARLLRGVEPLRSVPKAVISPHAGYAYSGALMARAVGALGGAQPDAVVILSPSHQHAFDGIALPSWDSFGWPGGALPVDRAAREALVAQGLAHVEDAAHDREHGVEVQLPVLRAVLGKVPLVPLVIGRASAKTVADAVDFLEDHFDAPLYVLSSDLSHFLPLDAAQAKDGATAQRIESGALDLRPEEACGARAISGFLASKTAAGLRFLRLGMANSHATSGDATRTVGYGAWALSAGAQEVLSDALRQQLLRTARQVLASRFNRGKPPVIDVPSFPAPLQTLAASFVTLTMDGRLRGCIGSLAAQRSMVEDVALNVQRAAFEDRRFRPLTVEDLPGIVIKIALLSPPGAMSFTDQADVERQLVPHRDGLILRDAGPSGSRAGTFLPMVWESLPNAHDFLQGLKVKAGLPRDHWSRSLTIERFHAESFAES
jgi:AmmeMemoRadiSam system protein B/AmmeMemoRadiSam system protein A